MVCSCMGEVEQVFSRVSEIFFISVSSVELALSHSFVVNCSVCFKVWIRGSIMWEFSSNNILLKLCALSLGIGLSILVLLIFFGAEVLLIRVFCGMFSCTGK